MRVQVISNASNVHQAQLIGKTTIVIDVIRTSSTIIAALEAGAKSVIPVETIMEAKAIARENDLLGGERFCKQISGFDLGNSPSEYTCDLVRNKRVILTTTNGTRAIIRSKRASELFIASLSNADACIEAAARSNKDLVLICAGSHDEFTIEDGLCAGRMITQLLKLTSSAPSQLTMNDFGYAMLSLYEHTKDRLQDVLKDSFSGKRLQEIGMLNDIDACMQINSSTLVPYYIDNELVAYLASSK